jgi:Uncharacterized protein conserved in bacteria (DUF2213)
LPGSTCRPRRWPQPVIDASRCSTRIPEVEAHAALVGEVRDAEFRNGFVSGTLALDWLGNERQLSLGYDMEHDGVPGIVGGERYDGVITYIRPSHVALVGVGNCGPACSILAPVDSWSALAGAVRRLAA